MSANDTGAEDGLFERFPAMRRLLRGERRIPFIRQLSATECGAACLAMVLGYHGKEVRLEELRETTGCGRDGGIEVEDLQYVPTASILHWEFSHFVVFERLRQDAVDIIDPDRGRRRVPLAHFRRCFTGVALLLEPSDAFVPGTVEG